METEIEENWNETMTFESNGISMEHEFAFGKAVGEFLRGEVRAGTISGNYILNLKDQMRMRDLRETENDRKPLVLLVGAIQMWRLGEELVRIGYVDVIGCVRMEAENTERKNMGF
jgi:hypothetical protein